MKWRLLTKTTNPYSIMFHVVGIVCIIWFLARVLPKPDRIRYPCQQMSLTFAASYITFWTILWGAIFSGLAFWVKKAKYKTMAFAPVLLIASVLIFSVSSNVYATVYEKDNDSVENWTPTSLDPMGVPTGANPGRVVWIWNPDATRAELSGYWWNAENNNQEVIDSMMSQGITNLAGIEDEGQAWDVLFKYFNEEHDKGNVSYQPGEKIAIKINMNNCWPIFSYYYAEDNDLDASPYVVKALLKQLTDVVGVNQEDITVYDSSRPLANWFYNRVVSEFPDINYVDSKGGASGRQKAQSSGVRIYFAEGSCDYRTLPVCVVEADYLINMPIMKRHPIQSGVTLSGKNLFGTWIEEVAPVHPYHQSGMILGNPTIQTDLLAHEHLGGKTLLYLGDGLYSTKVEQSVIEKFDMYPFEGDWTNSLLFSQDPVAIDSVMYDFLYAEGTNPTEGSQNYLHQSAVPTPDTYDPENDGEFLEESLGVHEHWDASTDIFSSERYSGIDFVAIYEEDVGGEVTITQPKSNYLYFNGRELFKLWNTIILGAIDVKAEVSGPVDFQKVEFYLDDELVTSDDESPYIWSWNERKFGIFTIKTVGYYGEDDQTSDTITVWKIY
jgi:hypothetical protein